MTRITDERAAHFDFVISQTGHLGALEARELLSDRSDSAAEIERLRAELTEWQESHRNHARSLELRTQMWKSAEALLAECKAALEPLTDCEFSDAWGDTDQIECLTKDGHLLFKISIGEFRIARALLSRLCTAVPAQTKALVEVPHEKIARLQREIGQRQAELQFLVLGDPRQTVSFATAGKDTP